MTTNPVQPSSSPNKIASSKFSLQTDDFIKMMITQLQNQDPLNPEKNQDLLAQMSQIGQLQSTTQLQSSIQTMVLQSNLGAAGNLIGKMVQGKDGNGAPLSGLVSSVRVQDNSVYLELDSGQTLQLDHVTEIAGAKATTAAN